MKILENYGLPPNPSPEEIRGTDIERKAAIKVAKKLGIDVPLLGNPPTLEKLKPMAGKNFHKLLKEAMRFETSPIKLPKIKIAEKFGVPLTPRRRSK